MKAREIMTPHPVAVTPQDPIPRAAAIMRDRDIGLLPVIESATDPILLGVITDRDIASRCVASEHPPQHCLVQHHMTPLPLDTVAPASTLDDVLALMARDQIRRVLVTEDGRLVGIIGGGDIARHCGEKYARQLGMTMEAIYAPPVHGAASPAKPAAKPAGTRAPKRAKAAR